MRYWVNRKWRKISNTYIMPRYFPLNSSGLAIIRIDPTDPRDTYWLIGKEVSLDIWVHWEFGQRLRFRADGNSADSELSWVQNNQISVTIKNQTTQETYGSKFFSMPAIGMSARSNPLEGAAFNLKFFPEDMGMTTAGSFDILIEIEAFAFYGYEGPKHIQWGTGNLHLVDWGIWSQVPDDSNSYIKIDDEPDVEAIRENDLNHYETIAFYGEIPISAQSVMPYRLDIVSGVPVANFTPTPASGDAPLSVAFQNTTVPDPYFPITAARWYFDDDNVSGGGTSTELGLETVVPHIYEKPGTYHPTLIVTNAAGSSVATSKTITVSTAGIGIKVVADDETYLPQACYPNTEVTLKVRIQNQGAAGNFWLKCSSTKGTKTIISSQAIGEYTDILLTLPAHTLEWYAGYTPNAEEPISIQFTVGPVGQTVTGNLVWETFLIGDGNCPAGYTRNDAGDCVEDCPTGYTRNDAGDCVQGSASKPSKLVLFGGLGVVLLGLGILWKKK